MLHKKLHAGHSREENTERGEKLKTSGIGIVIAVITAALLLTIAAICVFGTAEPVVEGRVFEVREPIEPHREVPQEQTESAYVLRSYGFGLGLFRAGEDIPFDCIEAELSCLPDCDKAALEAGITVETESQLRALAEDFSS